MSRFNVSNEVECPFYSSEDAYKIRCEGLEDSSTTHVVFPLPDLKKEYKRRYCCTKYKDCLLYKALYNKYES